MSFGQYQDALLGHTSNIATDKPLGSKQDTIIAHHITAHAKHDTGHGHQVDIKNLQTAGNNTLSSIDNKVILPSALDSDRLKVYDSAVIGSLAQINNNVDGVETKLDTINTTLTGGGVVDTSALATHAKQDTINSTLGDTNNKIDAMRASDSLTTVKTSTDAINTTLGDTNSKIDAMRASDTLTTVKDAIDALEASLTSMEAKQDTQITHLSEIEGAVETVETAYGLNKCNVNISTDNVGLATSANQTNGTAIVKIMGSEDATTGGTQRQIHIDGNGNLQTNIVNTIFQVPANSANSHITDDPANSMAVGLRARTTIGTATTEQFLQCNSGGSLHTVIRPEFSSVVNLFTNQSITGSGTHTTAAIANIPSTTFTVEHTFASHANISYALHEGLTNGGAFYDTGQVFNQSGDPTAGQSGINAFQVRSPFFKLVFSNTGATQDATVNYVVS